MGRADASDGFGEAETGSDIGPNYGMACQPKLKLRHVHLRRFAATADNRRVTS